VRAALPSQIDTMLELVNTGDWQAVRFRLADQVPPLIGLSSSLVADVDQEVAQERARALESIQRTRRQLYLVLPITALLILVIAAMLGWYATRRISGPLAQLDAGAQALARGEFGYKVELRGKDELADLARAFNYAAQRLHELYDVIKRDEAYLAESNARLEEAQRIAHLGYWEWDLTTDRVTWAEETYRIYGLQPQEHPIELAEMREMIHPKDREFVFRTAEEALRGGVRPDVEHRIVRPTGEVRIVHSQGDVNRDASGRPYRMFGTIQDITERKSAEEALQQSQSCLAEGERLAHMGSWTFNPSGFFEHWSQELFKIYGLDPQRGSPTLEEYLAIVHPADRDFMAETIRRMHAERSGCDVKKRIVRPDGEQRYIRCVGIPVIEDEMLKGFLGTAIDITEQELLTQELERRQANLTEAQILSHTGSFGWKPERLSGRTKPTASSNTIPRRS
jgi:PAS domain S-box-containing protein